MDKSKELLAKRALAPSAHDRAGAFVEIEDAKLSAHGHYLRGVREALNKYRVAFELVARHHILPGVGNEIMAMIAPMYQDELRVTVELTEEARRCDACTIHELKIGKH